MAQQIIENPGSIFGRIGSGFGKGLAEQLPKEFERHRLSSGLDRFKQESLSKTPIEQAVDLYKIPGFTPEMGYTLAPLLQQQRARNELIKYGKGNETGAKASPTSGMAATQGIPTEIRKENVPKSITNLETERATREPNFPPTQKEINELAAALVEDNPGLFDTPEKARLEASNRLNDEYNRKQALRAQSAVNDTDKAYIDAEIAKQTGEVNAGNIAKEEYQKIRNKAYQDVGEGKKTKLQAASDAKDEILDLDKKITALKLLNDKWLPNPTAAKNALENIKDKFKDREELFSQLLTSEWGLSPHYAKNRSNPVKENKAINNQLAKLKTEHLGGAAFLKNAEKGYPRETKIAQDIASNLKPNDSLLAIALELWNKGYNEVGFMKEIQRLKNEGKISLSDPQLRELDKDPKVQPTLSDFYYFSISGLDDLLEQE